MRLEHFVTSCSGQPGFGVVFQNYRKKLLHLVQINEQNLTFMVFQSYVLKEIDMRLWFYRIT